MCNRRANLKHLPLWQKLLVLCIGCLGFALVVALIIQYFTT